ncbi:2-acylglycerol O-acyltransferase [Aureococcus anophagefferens]|uniref:diacylglycerol O-acyltransferase n=1 Tax=Aureococcus anophagefferens TaxID=44056 RepID=A0ABR1G3G3_AURAN
MASELEALRRRVAQLEEENATLKSRGAVDVSASIDALQRVFPAAPRASARPDFFDDRSVYLFGYHPHGIISVGCFTQFAFDGSGASKLFPKLRFHCATLGFNFRIPFFRELLLGLGIIEVSAKSIKNALSSGPGAAVVIVPGGAAESLDASPAAARVLTLRKRNGFFRIALQHGAKLVPVFSFGENDLYGVRGSNSATFGSPMPMRRPIITVVGDPIACPRIPEPTQEQIDDLKVQYIGGRLRLRQGRPGPAVLTIDK